MSRLSLPHRLILVSAGASLASVATLVATPLVDGLFFLRSADSAARAVDLSSCADAPRSWIRVAPPYLFVPADAGGRPFQDDVAPLPPEVVAWPPGRFGPLPGSFPHPRAVLRTDDPVCALLVVEALRPGPVGAVVARLAAAAALGVGIGFSLVTVFGIWPLARALQIASRAAETMGTERFELEPDATDDDLGRLRRALTLAHGRIRADAERLEAQRDAVEDHLAAIAHDVRTPLAALSLGIESLHRERPGPESRLALQECAWLALLIDNLNQESRQRVGAFRARFDLVDVVERLAARFALLARLHERTFSVGIDVPAAAVDGDVVGAERALGNLVYNAIVHGTGDVALTLGVEGPDFAVEVWDAGRGVPADVLAGARADRRGLGLRIVRAVAREHGWSLARIAAADGAAVRLVGPLASDPADGHGAATPGP